MKFLMLILAFMLFSSTAASADVIHIDQQSRSLTLVDDDGFIYTYPIAVGKDGFRWTGVEVITRKAEWPNWYPTENVRRQRPELPAVVPGGKDNPLGARALYLGDTLYRIHGSNDPKSIGRAASRGCFRMRNSDIIDLYDRVDVGTVVIVQ